MSDIDKLLEEFARRPGPWYDSRPQDIAKALLRARKQLRYHRLALNEVQQAMARAGRAVNVSFRFSEMDKLAGVVADDPELEELLR